MGRGTAPDALRAFGVGVGATGFSGPNKFLSRPEFQAVRFILVDTEGPEGEEDTPSRAVSCSRCLEGGSGPAQDEC